jgi:RNA polymerase sigma-70 factor (ECF subfamily)
MLVFLRSVLRDEHAAADCLQTTFSKLVETGGPPVAGNLRGWLFRVAHNCARELQRRSQIERRGLEQVAILRQLADGGKTAASSELFSRRERLEQARNAVRQLSTSQQQVLRMRIEDGMKFAEIAQQLNLPLGTVLTRMRLALESVRRRVRREEAGDGE